MYRGIGAITAGLAEGAGAVTKLGCAGIAGGVACAGDA
jgi:hypothetical protein